MAAAVAAGLSSLVTPSISHTRSRTLQKLVPDSQRGSIKQSTTKCSHEGSSNSPTGPAAIQPLVVNRRAAMVASFGFSACACCRDAVELAAMAAEEDWSYGGPSGPPLWTGTCATGQKQSPINVPWKEVQRGEALGALVFDYQLSSPIFTNPGHGTMEVDLPKGVNKLLLKGRELNLVQFHFHTPSEHAFDGVRFPMEAHLVHRDAVTDAIAVVGIMLDAIPEAKPNGALTPALQYSPLQLGKPAFRTVPKDFQITAADLLPPTTTKNEMRRYVHYSGSLTTPTCNESVDWFLLEKPLVVSTREVLEFLEFVGNDQTLALNARPVQPLKGRLIFAGP